jgi:hypothetical protein
MTRSSIKSLLLLLATLFVVLSFVSRVNARDADDDEPIIERVEEAVENAAETVKNAVKRALIKFAVRTLL